jgi:hypothetical protein
MKNTGIASLLGKSDRRQALKKMGLGATALGLGLSGLQTAKAGATSPSGYPRLALTPGDLAVLDFALNLEYLEAQYYSYATTGAGIDAQGVELTGRGKAGAVNVPASPKVTFTTPSVQQYAMEIASDELAHVNFLRGVVAASGYKSIAQPAIDLVGSFAAAASAAGLGSGFSPFTSELNFLLGAFIFEDVGVTAYHGALPSLINKTVLTSAAGIMGTEAYHAAEVRAVLYGMGSGAVAAAQSISNARNSLGGEGLDQGPEYVGLSNNVPADANGIVFARSSRLVLNIVYLGVNAKKGGFFPNGINA